jgi:ABC-type uncharacterized transport system substrate-binding protein
MTRIAVMVCLVVAVLGRSALADAQSVGKMWRIGWLTISGPPRQEFRQALGELGYVEGQTIVFETRSSKGSVDRLRELAVELVRSKVDVVVAVSPAAIKSAAQATTTIPIVMAYWGVGDLLESGLVKNFARPGANVTGLYMLASELNAKRLELLLEAVPKARRVALLRDFRRAPIPDVEQVARAAGVQIHVADVRQAGAYEGAFESIANARADAVLVLSSPVFSTDSKRILELAAKRRLPVAVEWEDMAADGGLVAYGATRAELDRRAATFVDRLLKGASPADLPVEQPTKFVLAVNMRTAKVLGLTIPPSLLLRADRLIE